MTRIKFDAFTVRVSPGWADITDSLEIDDPPYTLAHTEGVGALQFSVALYQSGVAPEPTLEALREMVEAFGRKRGLGEPSAVAVEMGPPMLVAGSFAFGEDFLRVWQVSDSRNFAFVTYTAAEVAGSELDECETIVRSIVFQ